MSEVGTIIKNYREKNHLLQCVLADQMNVTKGYLSRVEAGTKIVKSMKGIKQFIEVMPEEYKPKLMKAFEKDNQ